MERYCSIFLISVRQAGLKQTMKSRSDYRRADPTATEAHTRGGRPTKAAAALRDERLLEIATKMFMQHGFDATSMERLAESAMIGKATLYARYADKSQLFADVLRRRILLIYGPLEDEFIKGLSDKGLEDSFDPRASTYRPLRGSFIDRFGPHSRGARTAFS